MFLFGTGHETSHAPKQRLFRLGTLWSRVRRFAVVSLLAHAQASIPYVGCSGDGQTGPYAAAKGSPKHVNLPLAIADQLAWYEYNGDAGHFGTLGREAEIASQQSVQMGGLCTSLPNRWTVPSCLNTINGRLLRGQPFNFPAPTVGRQVA